MSQSNSQSNINWRQGVNVQINFTGLDELVFELEKRSVVTARKALASAARRGARLVAKDGQRHVWVESRTLQHSVGVRNRRYRTRVNGAESMTFVSVVGPRVSGWKYTGIVIREIGKWFSKSQMARPEKYAHLVALGVKRHGIVTKRGKVIMHPGFRGKPFMDMAAQTAGAQVSRLMEEIIAKAIQGQDTFTDSVLGDG